MPSCHGSCRARLRLQSIQQDATPSTLSGHLFDFFPCILWRRCDLMDSNRDGREAGSSRTAAAMMLQNAAYSRQQNSSSTRER
eukprot:361306-Chlamydomonas_euryale.AAC.3